MEEAKRLALPIRFGIFEVDLQAGELRRKGLRVKLQDQPFQVLVTLLERRGEVVTREELQTTLWPADTFVDFDRGLNRAMNRVREALGEDADSPRFIETLPRRGYRFIAPVETAAADPGVRVPEDTPRRALSRKWVVPSASVLLILLLSLGLRSGDIRERLHWRRAPPRIASLAVLPLENLSGDPAQEYFAEAMTDELITEVSKISPLRVISRSSVMQYKRARKPLPVIAQELGVDAVLEGTVTHFGQKVRITAQLIQAREDRHLWSDSYERDLSDVMALQAEVAQAIAGQIQIKMTPREHASLKQARPVAPHAYEAYLEGSFFRSKATEAGLDKAIQLFSKAIELDPEYPQGYAGLSNAYCLLGIFGLRPSREVYPKARAAALRALELDDSLAEAHNSLADVKKGYDWDWVGAEAEYKRALELDPSYSMAHAWYAEYLSKMGRYQDAIAEAMQARQLDPISANSNVVLGMIYYRAGRYDEALAAGHKTLEFDPNHPSAFWLMALAHEQKRDLSAAILELEKAVSLSGGAPIFRAQLANAYAQVGDRAKALGVLHELMTLSKQKYVSPLDIAVIYTGLGDRGSAFQWLETAYQERTMRIQELPQPIFHTLRSDPRFQDLVRRVGLPL